MKKKSAFYTTVPKPDVIYIAGGFSTVGATTRNNLAAVNADTGVNELLAWNPNANATVRCIVLNGSNMYLGGDFTTVRGTERNYAAAVESDPTNGSPQLRAWNPNCYGSVYCMVLSGDHMYLGGLFTTVRGSTRNRAAAVASDVNATNPTLRAWNPDCSATVRCMVLSGDHMYLGGAFTTVRGSTRNRAAAVASDVNAANPTLRAWNPNCGSSVFCMILSGSNMYLGGMFNTVSAITRERAAAVDSNVDEASPSVRTWRPQSSNVITHRVEKMILSGSDMYLCGWFDSMRGTTRKGAAAVASDTSTSTLRNWNPDVYSSGPEGELAWAINILLNGDDMYIGGPFTSVRGSTRNAVAAVASSTSSSTPTLRAWNPNINGSVHDMVLAT